MPWFASLVQGLDGNFYGTTAFGGIYNNGCNPPAGVVGCGTVFKITPQGTLTSLHSFDLTDGAAVYAGLALGTNGYLYGVTSGGPGAWPGPGWDGTVFRITPRGVLTTLHNFDGNDGLDPEFPPVQTASGNLYGTTVIGGANNSGTVFTMTPAGALTTLYSFSGTNGAANVECGLVQAMDGNFYGSTSGDGSNSLGTVFKITPAGKLTVLHNFSGPDGALGGGTFVQGSDGNLYGTTYLGGACNLGTIYSISLGGAFTNLYSFCGTDGAKPSTGLIQATDGNLYGTTSSGGIYGSGTIFTITTAGAFSSLYSFNENDGANPVGRLLQATDGNFYGTTRTGGANGVGTVYRLSLGLGPFVKALPALGWVGTALKILGTNLTGATSVTLNGSTVPFTVVSPSLITALVPAGATSGKVQVITPNGTLLSNVTFRVIPAIWSFSPESGPAGTTVVITGQSLTGALIVTFGGVKATAFTVDSYTQITATVPVGAQTGKIGVVTPGGIAVSADTFTVGD